MYQIGKIVKTHGIKGEVKVMPTTDFNRFVKGKVIYYYENDNKVFLTIKEVRVQQAILIIKFVEINSLNESELIHLKLLFTDEEPKLEKDEYTKDQLIGLEVYSLEGDMIGEVVDLMFLPSQEMLVVKSNDNKRILIPFLKEFVVEVTDKITVKLIEGLI